VTEVSVPLRVSAKKSSASCVSYTISPSRVSATCLSQFILISSDSRQPTRSRFTLVQTSSNHACVRSTAWAHVHQCGHTKLDWLFSTKRRNNINQIIPLWLFSTRCRKNMDQIIPVWLQPAGLASVSGLQSAPGHDLQAHPPCGQHISMWANNNTTPEVEPLAIKVDAMHKHCNRSRPLSGTDSSKNETL